MATSSHTADFTGLPEGITSVRVSVTGADPNSSANKRDASTLDLADGSTRVYVAAPLLDVSPGEINGKTVTVSIAYLGTGPQTVGSTTTAMGYELKCTASEVEYAVGELRRCTATYVAIDEAE